MKRIVPLIIAAAFVAGGGPALAVYPLDWQPAAGPVQVRELTMERQLDAAFFQGLISTYELAQMKRNLDGIRCYDEYHWIESSIGPDNVKTMKKLDLQQAFLDNHIANKKATLAQVTVTAPPR